MKTIILSTMMALVTLSANAQVGKVLNKVKNQTQEAIENAVNVVTEGANHAVEVAQKEVRDVLNDETTLLYGNHTYTM